MDDNQRILVIDDDPGVRDAFKEILVLSPTSGIAERGAALFGEETPSLPSCPPQSYELTLAENGDQGVMAVERALEKDKVLFTVAKYSKLDASYRPRPSIKVALKSSLSEADARLAAKSLAQSLASV